MAGCVSPVIDSPEAGTAKASASGSAATVRHPGAVEEDALASVLAAAARLPQSGLPAGFAAWSASAAAMCAVHARVLSQDDPLVVRAGGSASPSASTKPSGQPSAVVAGIAKSATALAAAHTTRCLAAAAGDEALLWASLATAATSLQTVSRAPVRATHAPVHCDVGTPAAADTVLLDRVHSMIYGLGVVIGQLPIGDALVSTGRARLNEVMLLRDQLQARIRGAGATPAPPALSYPLPGGTSGVAALQQTWGHLEYALLAAFGRRAAATTGGDRSAALREMIAQVPRVVGRGVPLDDWPGWV